MSDWQHLRDEEESDRIREVRAVAQSQFVSLSREHVKTTEQLKRTAEELERYRTALRSAQTRARELGLILREEQ